MVLKGSLAFRLATQLDPVDSIVMSALLYEYGPILEASRLPTTERQVFSYRFAPDSDGRMYGQTQPWHNIWLASKWKAASLPTGYVLIADIADFYNQIYHHVLERHFAAAGLAEPIIKIFKRYLQTLTDKDSRGVPVGPHSSHILAECALDALDRSLKSHGLVHCRYVDDIHIFVDSYENAVGALYTLIQILDSQQRLVVQNSKTQIVSSKDFQEMADAMLLDNPINANEAEVLAIIARVTSDDRYTEVHGLSLPPNDLAKLDRNVLEDIIVAYLRQQPVNFRRLAWLIRRLTQVGAPGAIDVLINNIANLNPILGPVARYFVSAVPQYAGDRMALGGAIVQALNSPIISQSPYLQMLLMDIIASIPDLNHVDALTARYLNTAPTVRPGILLAAASGGRSDWLRDRKSEFRGMDPWCRRAFIKASATLPGDESKFWFESVRDNLLFLDRIVAKCCIPGARVGEIRISQG